MTDDTTVLERTEAEAWLHRTITARGGLANIEEWERWLLYERAKAMLPSEGYERGVRTLAEMLGL